MNYATLCSGIGAPEVAWSGLGWWCAFQSEVDPFACAVLAQRFPGVENRGDMTRWRAWPVVDGLDVLVAGTPCQSFSVAGKRGGMRDARGNLAMEYVAYANHVRPRWVLWENVPGVLSDKGNAFGDILGGLAGSATAIPWNGRRWGNAGFVSGPRRQIAWRILDAQYYGLAQRRRRVFVCATDIGLGARSWACARALFPDAPRVRGDIAPGACAAADSPGVSGGGIDGGGIDGGGGGGGRCGGDVDCFASLAMTKRASLAMTITAGVGRGRGLGYDEGGALVAGPITASYDRGRGRTGGNNGGVVDGHLVASTLTSSMGVRRGCGVMEGCGALVAHTLCGEGHDSSEDGTGRGVPLIFEQRVARNGRGGPSEIAPALRAECGRTGKGDAALCVLSRSGIRRLTPRECERLQGFPDDRTLVPWADGRRPRDVEAVRDYLVASGYGDEEAEVLAKTPDGHRYRAIGNSMAVTVMRWLGERIADVEKDGRPE